MTKKQRLVVEAYKNKLLDLKENTDREAVHVLADNLILESLKDLGFKELVDAYVEVSEIGFWYA